LCSLCSLWFALMAKKEKTKKKPRERKPGLLKRWLSSPPSPRRRAIGFGLLKLLILAAFVGGTVWGLGRLRTYVFSQPEFARSTSRIQLMDRPEWMNDWLADQLANELLPYTQSDWTFDPRLAESVHQAGVQCPWVKSVTEVSVERAPGARGDKTWRAGRVVVRAEWRRPVAVGVWRDREEYVAADGVVLPKEQTIQIIAQLPGLARIEGLAEKPPAAGHQWGGADLQAALTVVAMFREKPYYSEIAAIDVSNFSRRNLLDPAIKLIATAGQATTEIRYGQLIPDDSLPVDEPKNKDKLTSLDNWYRQNNNQLAGPKWLELRFGGMRRSSE
jgi:hypothetical protein